MPKKVRAPSRLTLRSYNVGFGDCFLLTFHYGKKSQRHVLIDFGSTGLPKNAKSKLPAIAADIAQQCGNKLHAVVATHRHKDHISGFATTASGDGPGDIIRGLKPDVVVQPWTEHPDAAPDARGPIKGLRLRGKSALSARARTATLEDMHVVAKLALRQSQRVAQSAPLVGRKIAFLGENNLKNESAVRNLMTIAPRRHYVYFGAKSGLESVLPGVRISVLGPPTVEQSEDVLTQRTEDENEFWHLQSLAQRRATTGEGRGLLSRGRLLRGKTPAYARWFIPKLDRITGDQLLQIVREVDEALNNTSVILLLEVGGQAFLFPGDAQIENWAYALSKPAIRKRLAAVTLYKVGHHGSLNATPKTLWGLFRQKGAEGKRNRLRTVVSTMAGKHGSTQRGTEVPRRKLVSALEAESEFISTQRLRGKLFHEIDIPL